jgi:hypothetical protein
LGRAEKVLLGAAFGLTRTWSIQADKLVRRWEVLTAQREAAGTLPPNVRTEYDRLKEQMEIVFDDNPADMSDA